MIAYQEYNTKSPLNGLAAKWAAQHTHMLPVDPRDIAPPALIEEKTNEAAMAAPIPDGQATEVKDEATPWSKKIVID